MYAIMIELAKQTYGDAWEQNLRRLVRDVLKRDVSYDRLTLAEVNQICAEIIKEG